MPHLLLCLRFSVQWFSSILRASVLPPPATTLSSGQAPTFLRCLTFLYWVLSLFFNFHTSLSPIFLTSYSPFLFINSCASSYCLSYLLPDEASGRNVVNSTVCCSTLSCSLNFYTSILFVLHKWRNFFSVAHFGAAILVFRASAVPPAAATLPSVQPPTFFRFPTFLFWLLSLL